MKKQYFIFSDVHIGKKLPDSGKLHCLSLKYLIEEARRYKKDGVDYIGVVCGDLFDARLRLNPADLLVAKTFIDSMHDVFDRIYLVTGNHDMYTSLPGTPNILDIFTDENVTIVKEFLHNDDGVFVPFDDPILKNREDFIAEADSETYCFCHQAVKGIAPPLSDGIVPDALFDKFKLTVAGHIHIRAFSRKVISIGAPSSFSFADTDVDTFGALLIDEHGNHSFIDSPYYLKYKVFNINSLKDLDVLEQLSPRTEYCVKILVDPSISSKVDYILDNALTSEFALFKSELQNADIDQSVDLCENLHTGDTNSILSVIRKEFEDNEEVLNVFNNIVNDVIREAEEKEY